MTLEGAKFVCLDEAGNHGEVVLAKGRKFTMGCYVSCDYVLVDQRAKGVHCEIECDAFGRVTIRNLSPDKPIVVNGSSVEIKRTLLHNSKLSILNKEYLWLFKKIASNEFEDLTLQDASTPQKLCIPEQPPNSCPDFKLHRELPKRFTVHNFAYCIQSDEEGNESLKSNDNDSAKAKSDMVKISKDAEIQTTLPKETHEKTQYTYSKKEDRNRSITPEPNKEVVKPITELLETPKTKLNCTQDTESNSTQKENKQLLKMCHQSDIVITSFSPRETGVKILKSFATVIKPKIQVTKPPTTPKSVYSTPKCDMDDDVDESDLIAFYTPCTSKKGTGAANSLPTSSKKILKNSSMHLIDLTTPFKQKPASPYLKSALKASAKLPTQEQFGLTALSATPVATNISNNHLESSSSVISVDSSRDNLSVIEVTSDGSNMGITPRTASDLNTPIKAQTYNVASTPKKTPQSLMKKAILTSAKKQNTTTQKIIQNPTTPCREGINRIPLRSNLVFSKTPVTPQALTGILSKSQLPRRQSMSTPTLKCTTGKRFGDTPSSSNILLGSPSSSAKTCFRRSTLNPLSAAKALPTSTPVSVMSAFKRRGTCKTSPLHKVRKSLGGIPLSSHISKSRKSIKVSSASKIMPIKNKSPQQVMSCRLVNRARKYMIATPIPARSPNMKEPTKSTPNLPGPSSILKDKKTFEPLKWPKSKAVLFTEGDIETDNLSRTFTLDSSDDENVDVKKDATFSPAKVVNTETQDKTRVIEIPVDAKEVVDFCRENKENTNQTNNEENNIFIDPCYEVKYNIATEKDLKLKDKTDNAANAEKIKSFITEESFAEEVNESLKKNNITNSNAIAGTQMKSSLISADTTDIDTTEELKYHTSIKNENDNTSVVETGFGEESSILNSNTSGSRTTLTKESEHEDNTDTQSHRSDISNDRTKQVLKEVSVTKANDEVKSLVEKAVEDSEIETNDDAKKQNEYKPIVEDITLESSLIEKETKDNEEIDLSKHPLYLEFNEEGSVLEEKVKSNAIKEETIKTVIEESVDKEHISAISKHNEMSARLENKKLINIDVANIILTEEETITPIQEKEETYADESKKQVKYVTNPIDINSETTTTTQQNKDIQSEAFSVNDEAQEEETDLTISHAKQLEEFHTNVTLFESPTKVEVDSNLEDTNKLLEEIEDVLNKSDEIKQKQLDEIENSIAKPLTEEFESEQFSQEIKDTETLHIPEFSNAASFESKKEYFNTNLNKEEPEKETKDKITAEIPESSAANLIKSEKENIDTNKDTNADLLNTFEQKSKIQNENATEEEEGFVKHSENNVKNDVHNHANKPKSNDSSNIENNVNIHNVELTEEHINESDNNTKQLKLINKNVENVVSFTPRRSARRPSQSNDPPETIDKLNFTPRRSTRRSSMSAESATTITTVLTPIKRTTRRSSLSVVNDTPLTPKSTTKRRVSISLEDQPFSPSKSKLQQRAKTPRKLIAGNMIIPEENDDVCNVIMEGEEVSEQDKIQIEKNKNTLHEEKVSEVGTEAIARALCVESRNEENLSAETILETELTCENILLENANQDATSIVTDKNQTIDVEVVSTLEDIIENNTNANKVLNKICTPVLISNDSDVVRDNVGLGSTSSKEVIYNDEDNTKIMEAANALKDQSVAVEDKLQCNIIDQEHLVDCREKLQQAGSAYHTIVDQDYIQDKSPRTPLLSSGGMPDLLKTPKTEICTPLLGNMKNSSRTPNVTVDEGEFEYLAQTANFVNFSTEVKTPKATKKVIIVADSPRTPLMSGVRELLRTPKPETKTPRLAGIRNLVLTPKNTAENEAEEIEKFAGLSDLVKTPEISTPKLKKRVTIAAESPKTPLMLGMRELLKTPKDELSTPESGSENVQEERIEKLAMMHKLVKSPVCSRNSEEMPSSTMECVKELTETTKSVNTPCVKGICELIKTPKVNQTPNTTGLMQLPYSPMTQPSLKRLAEDLPSTTSQSTKSYKGVKELLKTPKSCSTPRLRGLRELMKTPKSCSTPILSGIRELLDDSAVQQKDKELEKFLKTPTAKNIMITSMPASAVIEKNSDCIEVSTEYDLNVTNEREQTNLGELFKTPGVSNFVERITCSYYGDEDVEDVDYGFNTQNETMQDKLSEKAEEAFDKLIGQESQIKTPLRKIYARKSFTLQTPTCSSPFTAAEVLSDLPKTDVEEWIENLEQAEPHTMIESDLELEEKEKEDIIKENVKKSSFDAVEDYDLSVTKDEPSNYESIVPQTCAKIFIAEQSHQNKSTTSLTYTDSKDPLFNTETKLKGISTVPIDAEISGINLLDQSMESIQDEPSVLDESLFVDEPSMFDEPLVVSDNESESEDTFNITEVSQGGGNELSEPLLVSDSEDLNQSLERESSNKTVETENELEITEGDINGQEKSMLEQIPSEMESMTEDPLKADGKETSFNKSNVYAENVESNSIKTKDQTLNNIDLSLKNIKENSTVKEILHNIEHSSETEVSKITDILEKDSSNNANINIIIESIDSEIDAAETLSHQAVCADLETSQFEIIEVAIEQTKMCSTESENVFVDSSVIEICEETNVLSGKQTELKEELQTISEKRTEDECQDIFLDDSNIDETFANEENVTAFNQIVTTKPAKEEPPKIEPQLITTSKIVEFESLTGTSSVAKKIECSSQFNADSQYNQGEHIEHEHVEIDFNTTPSMLQKSTDMLKTEIVQGSTPDTNLKESEEQLEHTTESPCVTEKYDSLQVDAVSQYNRSENTETEHVEKETSPTTLMEEVSIDIFDETVIMHAIPKTKQVSESTVEAISVNEMVKTSEENLERQYHQSEIIEQEHIETDTIETLNEAVKLDITNTEEVPGKTLPDEYLTKVGKIKSSSFCDENVLEESEKTVLENETFCEIKTDSKSLTTELKQINEKEQQLFLETKDDENTNKNNIKGKKSSKSIAYDNAKKAEEPNMEINFTPESEDTLASTENKTDEIVLSKNKIPEEKITTSLSKGKASNIADLNSEISEKDDGVIGNKPREELKDNTVIEVCKDHKETLVPVKVSSKESNKMNIEPTMPSTSIQQSSIVEKQTKSMSEKRISLTEFRNDSTPSTMIIRYDLEIKIKDAENSKETEEVIINELAASSNQTKCSQSTHEIIPQNDQQVQDENMQIPENNENPSDERQCLKKREKNDIIVVKTGGEKGTVADISQESMLEEEIRKSSRTDRCKMFIKPAEENLEEEVLKEKYQPADTITDVVKEEKRKLTRSESSQGSVIDFDEGCIKTRKGGHLNSPKSTHEVIVREDKDLGEVTLLKQFEDKKCEEPKTIETAIESEENITESKTASNIEKLCNINPQENEFISIQDKTRDNQVSVKKVMTVSECQVAAVNRIPADEQIEIGTKHKEDVSITPTDELNEEKLYNKQQSASEEGNPNKLKENKVENQGSIENEKLSIIESQINPVPIQEKEILENIVGRKTTPPEAHKSKLPIIAIKEAEQKINYDVALQENSTSADATAVVNDQILCKSESHKPTVLESSQKMSQEDASVTVKDAEVPYRQSRRKPSVSETIKNSLQVEGNERSRNTRRKVQKAPLEKVLAEESQDKEENTTQSKSSHDIELVDSTRQEIKPFVPESRHDLIQDDNKTIIEENECKNIISNLIVDKTDKTCLQAKEILNADISCHFDDKTESTVQLEAAESTQTRTRRKPNISKSSPDKATSRTRKGAYKAQKLSAEAILIEEEKNKIDLSIPADLNKNEMSSKDNIENTIKADLEISEVSQLLANVTEHTISQDKLARTRTTIEHESETINAPLRQAEDLPIKVTTKHNESQEVTSRRGRKKLDIQETIVDEPPTTSRKRHGKVIGSASEIYSGNNTKSEVKTLQADEEQSFKTSNAVNMVVQNVKDSKGENISTYPDSTPIHKGKRGKVNQTDEEKLTKEQLNLEDALQVHQQTEKDTSPKQTGKRGRMRKIYNTKEKEEYSEKAVKTNATSMTRRGVRHNTESTEIAASPLVVKGRNTTRKKRTPAELMTCDSQEQISGDLTNVNEISHEQPSKQETKETATNMVSEVELNYEKQLFQETELSNMEENQKEENKLSKKSVKRTHTSSEVYETPAKKPANIQILAVEESDEKGIVSLENTNDKNALSQNQREDDVAAEPQKSTKRKVAKKATTTTRRRKGTDYDTEGQHQSEDVIEEPLPSTRRRGVAKHVHESSSTIEKKLDSIKHVVEDNKTEKEHFVEPNRNENKVEIYTEQTDADNNEKLTKSSETKSRRRIISKKKSANKDQEEQFTEQSQKDIETTVIQDDYDRHTVSDESKLPQVEMKKGRGRRKKMDNKEASENSLPTAHSPETKSKVQNAEKADTDIPNDHTSKEKEYSSDNIEQQETTVPSTASTVNKRMKAIDHITAEPQETEDTPSRRARNVPQRRAATAYHNYDETSDSETKTKTKKKSDSPKKSLDVTKNSHSATITSAPIVSISPAPSSSASITTARGRTRKPTAKVQQFLEKERAKAETPKKKALLAAANVDAATTIQHQNTAPTEIDVGETPKASKGRGRGKIVVIDSQKDETTILTERITPTITEEKDIELRATMTIKDTPKVRRGRKAKIIEAETHTTNEPPAKKYSLDLEKKESSPLLEPPTPTRIAGRRNAAAAAKARIEEDALAAAAVEPLKKARAKKSTPKAAIQLITNTDADNYNTTAVEEEQNIKAENEAGNKSSSKKREHRLASASTVEEIENVDVEETNTVEKTSNKRGRKAATITMKDSPAVPNKRGRKAKIVEEVDDIKTTRGKGRAPKNVHFDEVEASSSKQDETDVDSTPVDTSEPVKRGTRTRRK